MTIAYDVKVLLEIAQEYLQAEEEWQVHMKTWKGGWVSDMEPGAYGNHCDKFRKMNATWSALYDACRLVYADIHAVLGTAKAMNRYEKREDYQVCAYLPSGYSFACHMEGEDRVRRFWAKPEWDAKYYQSTGRRIP